MALSFSKLTRNAVRAMKPGDRLAEHGVEVEKLKNGDVRFSVNVMVDGKRIHRVVGRESEGVTRNQAETLIEKLRTEAREGRLHLPQGRKLHRTFAESATEYLTRMEESGGKNLRNKRRHLEQHLIPYFGKHRLDRLTEFELRKYRKHRHGQGVKDATVNREFATLLHLLRRATSKDWKWIKAEDVPPIPRVAEKRKPIRILTPEQGDQLLTAAACDQDAYTWLFCMFGLNATMRHSEILRRRYDEIDWENCRIWIDKAKAGERAQPITPTLRDALKRQQAMEDDPNGWIFPTSHGSAKAPHRLSMAKQFKRAVIRAKLDPKLCTPHIMRHTGISRLVMANTDVRTVQAISGHKTVAMVMHYAHVFAPRVDSAISVLDTGTSGTVTQELHKAPEIAADSGADVVELSGARTAA